MQTKGTTISRWFDAVSDKQGEIDQPNPLRAMVYWGHAPNSQSRGPSVKAAIDAVELIVVIDPMPSGVAALADRRDNFYLLPAATTMEMAGSVTNSQRALQWREKVIDPLFEAKTDLEIMYRFARKFGYADELCRHIKVENNEPLPEDILREINRGSWSIGYTGQSPERLKLHMQHQEKFDPVTSMGVADPVRGEYYGLPWPCWGTPDLKHPGTPVLYDMSKPVAEGGLPFRANWGVEYKGRSLLADGVAPKGSAIMDGYPEFSMTLLEQLGWSGELKPEERIAIEGVARRTLSYASKPGGTDERRQKDDQHQGQNHSQPMTQDSAAEGTGTGEQQRQAPASQSLQSAPQDAAVRDAIGKVNWKTDPSGGIIRVAIAHGMAPFGNGRARAMVWNFPDPVPRHREPLYTPRRDLLAKYRTYDDGRDWRVANLYWSVQKNDFSQQYPLIMTSGRIVEFEGGGDETRSISWLAEFQQKMYAEVHPEDARRAGISDGESIWIETPEGARVRVSAHLTPGIGPGTIFLPFHFAGLFQGRDLRGNYPQGTVPYVVGESANTATTYGYDAVTMMQETKTTLCRVRPA